MADDRQIPESWRTYLQQEGARFDDQGQLYFEPEPSEAPVMAPLPHLAVLRIQGEDAADFLDGQLSAAIHSLPANRSVLTGWHDPKGRVLTTLLLLPDDTGFSCLMPRDLVNTILPRLKMYVLRSRVEIQHQENHVAIGMAGESLDRAPGQPLEGAPSFRYWTGAADDAPAAWQTGRELDLQPAGPQSWRRYEIHQGIPVLNADTSGLFLPQFLGLENLGGLSFKKGCYTGQEVIARTHYLGKVKQGLQAVHCTQRPEPSATIRDSQDKKVGQVVDAVPDGSDGWLLQIVTRASEGGLHLDDEAASPLSPAN